MFSIWFYFMPQGTAFEACGFPSKEEAILAISNQAWYLDEGGNDIFITRALKDTAIIKVCETAFSS